MKKLCICIPTYKRSECIEHILKTSADWSREYDIDFYIFDSSADGKTAAVIEKYRESYGDRLVYELETDYPDKTTDLKVKTAFAKLRDRYAYIHLSGDGFVVDIPKYMKLLEQPMAEEYDIIHFNGWLKNEKYTYTSGHDFARDNGWYATYYGATVMSAEMIKKADYDKLAETYRNSGFMYWYGMMCAAASDGLKIIAYKEFPLINNPFKPTNSSYQPGKFVNFWIIWWNRVNDALPAHYNDIKSKIKKDIGNYLQLYGFGNLLRLRESGNLDGKLIRENRARIAEVTDVPYARFVLVSLIPKGLIPAARKLKRKLKRS